MTEGALVAAVVVAWNHWSDTAECLDTLAGQDWPNLRVIVVDNGSTDGTPAKVRAAHPDALVIENGRNIGLSRAYNVGIDRALGLCASHVVILNNDTALEPDCISRLVARCDVDPTAGAVMPLIQYYDDRQLVWSAGARERSVPPGIVFECLGRPVAEAPMEARAVGFAPSCVLLLRNEAIPRPHAFDPDYFFFFGDWEFCERLRRSGWRLLLEPAARAYHKVSVSTHKATPGVGWWWQLGAANVQFQCDYRSAWYLAINSVWIFLRENAKGNSRGAIAFAAGVAGGIARRLGRGV